MTQTTQLLRPVAEVLRAPRMLEGEGFEVSRPIPGPGYESVGPFIMLDQFGPVEYGPGEAKGAPEHPHFGFETLTYLLEGRGLHRDSIGNVSTTGPGEAQWMRAGRGIVHDEGADEELKRKGGRSHGVQLWINLPRANKEAEPAYRAISRDMIPEMQVGDAHVRLLAGSLLGKEGPVTTFAKPWLAHVNLPAGGKTLLDVPGGIDLGAYVLLGAGKFGAEAREASAGELVRFGSGVGAVAIEASEALDVLVLGGPGLDAPILRYGPFVASSREQLLKAVRDYQTGKMGLIDFSQPAPGSKAAAPA